MRRRRLLLIAGGLLAAPLLAEALLAFALANPGAVPAWGPLRRAVRRAYVLEDWNVLQADPAALRPDTALGYRLAPGTIAFRNREFDTTLAVNAAGLRDDEDSLQAPEIIVLGDSFAMGWGVAQDESFPEQLARLTGLTVLNTGVPSWGTAREVLLLEQLDRSRLRAVVVQYFLNDHAENVAFLAQGAALQLMSPEDLAAQAREHAERLAYHPFDLLRAALDDIPFQSELLDSTPETLARTALLVLSASPALQEVPIVFVELGTWGDTSEPVAAAMQRLLDGSQAWTRLRQQIVVLRLSEVLDESDAFVLDPHLRASGHTQLARAIAEALAQRGVVAAPR